MVGKDSVLTQKTGGAEITPRVIAELVAEPNVKISLAQQNEIKILFTNRYKIYMLRLH